MTGKNQDTDFKSMSKEELKQWINTKGQSGAVQSEDTNNDKTAMDPVEDKPTATEQPTNDQDATSSKDPVEDKPTVTNNDPYAGKSVEDLLKIVQEQQKFISRQGNEIGNLKKKALEAIAKSVEPEEAKETDYGDYNKSDVDYIKNLIRDEFGNISKERQAREERIKQEAFEENHRAYNDLAKDPEVFNKLKPILDSKFVKAGQSAVYQKGWMRETINATVMEMLKGKTSTQPQPKSGDNGRSADINKRKQAASTITNTQAPVNSQPKKSVKEMSSNEFLSHIKENMGIKDKRLR